MRRDELKNHKIPEFMKPSVRGLIVGSAVLSSKDKFDTGFY